MELITVNALLLLNLLHAVLDALGRSHEYRLLLPYAWGRSGRVSVVESFEGATRWRL